MFLKVMQIVEHLRVPLRTLEKLKSHLVFAGERLDSVRNADGHRIRESGPDGADGHRFPGRRRFGRLLFEVGIDQSAAVRLLDEHAFLVQNVQHPPDGGARNLIVFRQRILPRQIFAAIVIAAPDVLHDHIGETNCFAVIFHF